MTAPPALVAVDFTADTLRVLLAEPDGTPLIRDQWPLPPLPDEDAWTWEVGGRIAALFAREGQRRSALSVAVAAPGTVDPLAGRLLHSEGQPSWDALPVVDALRRHLDAPVACENRTLAALIAEQALGAASGASDILYASLRDTPAAAMLSAGKPVRGAGFAAGALPAAPQLQAADEDSDALATVAGVLADAAALLDPQVVVLDAPPPLVDRLVPLLRRVLAEVAPDVAVRASALGEEASLLGAVRIAGTVAFEGERRA